MLGAKKAKKILDRFDISANEKAYVVKIIRRHHLIHNLFSGGNDVLALLRKFKKSHKDIFLELVMLGYADTLGCKPEKSVLENLRFRFKFYKGMLTNYD